MISLLKERKPQRFLRGLPFLGVFPRSEAFSPRHAASLFAARAQVFVSCERLVRCVALFADIARLDGGAHGASRLVLVAAIAESAALGRLLDIRERCADAGIGLPARPSSRATAGMSMMKPPPGMATISRLTVVCRPLPSRSRTGVVSCNSCPTSMLIRLDFPTPLLPMSTAVVFGGTSALIGGFDPFIQGDYSHLGLDIPLWVYIVFQTVFCATAATIVSGSMAERTNFKAYCVYSAAISLVVYPICGHWMWGGGWLQSMGFHDFAGSAAVHNVGGVIALLGAAMLGPRIGKYDKDGNPHAIPGHNLTAGALGVFILWFCWFGFNGGSSLSLATDEAMTLTGLVCFNTNLAAAVATCVTMIFTWLRYGKPDVSMTLNGSLAGLVAITAGCDAVSPFGAFIIGFVAGILVVLSVEFFDKIAKIDDPVGAVSVHFANGVWGTIAVGLFSNGGDGVGKGLFYGGGFAQLGTQLLGLITVDVYVVVVMFIIFKIIDKTIGLRVPAEVEIDGLDIHEHGLTSAYAGFSISDANAAAMVPNENTDLGEDDASKASAVQMNAAVPVVKEPAVIHDGIYDTGMHKVSIIAKLSKFDQLKTALNDLGVTGMTVTQVMGCGIQKGTTEKYRGVPVDSTLLPKDQGRGHCFQDQRGRCGGCRQKGPVHRPHRRWQDLCLQRDPRGQDPHRRGRLRRSAGCGVTFHKLLRCFPLRRQSGCSDTVPAARRDR